MRGHDFESDSIETIVSKCKKNSIKNIQLVLKKSIPGFKEGEFSKEYAKEIGDYFKSHGIGVSVLGCYINPSETNEQQLKNNLNYFIENLYYAKYIGADVVGLETGFVGDRIDTEQNESEEAYRHLLKNMRVLCKKAENLNVNIAIEGVHCFVINTPRKMKRLLDDLNSNNVKVIFDPVNYLNYYNYQNQTEIFKDFFELLLEKMAVIHLKDFKVENNNISYEYPCRGMLDKKYIFEMIKKYKPDIPVILENVTENMLPIVKEEVLTMYN